MEKVLSVTEARSRFAELVDGVRYQGDTVLLVKSGKPAAVIVSVDLFERWKEERKRRFEVFRQLQAKLTDDLSEEDAMVLALEAQQAVRAEATQERTGTV